VGAAGRTLRAEASGLGGPAGGAAGNLLFDDFMKIKKTRGAFHTSYIVQNPFKLNFMWREEHDPSEKARSENASGPTRMPVPSSQTIDCSVFAPQSLQLVKIPL